MYHPTLAQPAKNLGHKPAMTHWVKRQKSGFNRTLADRLLE